MSYLLGFRKNKINDIKRDVGITFWESGICVWLGWTNIFTTFLCRVNFLSIRTLIQVIVTVLMSKMEKREKMRRIASRLFPTGAKASCFTFYLWDLLRVVKNLTEFQPCQEIEPRLHWLDLVHINHELKEIRNNMHKKYVNLN